MSEREARYKYFGMVLYPDFDNNHNKLLKYLSVNDSYCRSIWICHDQDRYSEDLIEEGELKHFKGDPEKVHYHIMIKTSTQKTLSSVCKFFGHWVKHVEPITDHVAYALYMYHNTPESLDDEYKHKYALSDFQGDSEWLGQLLQNGYFVQLEAIRALIEQDVPLSEVYSWCLEHKCKDVFDAHQYLFVAMNNDCYKRKTDERNYKLKCKHYGFSTID